MASRRRAYFNPSARKWRASEDATACKPEQIHDFHRRLPNYSPTTIHSIPAAANELGVGAVYLKDESRRFNLPSFKILGASWGTFRALAQRFGLSIQSDVSALQAAVRSCPTTLFAATDGNHGRAVARIGSLFGSAVEIFVPKTMDQRTQQLIREEGAKVTWLDESYDEAVRLAYTKAEELGGVFVQDTAFPGYEEIPQWIVQGYATMLHEIDEQLGTGHTADLVVVPVGVGSFAQAVVSHYKAQGRHTSVLAVEPDTAACLWKSLNRGILTPTNTTHTIMSGLDCGTVSTTAWPLLAAGVDASVTISDFEAHVSNEFLNAQGIAAGPCGAAGLAALRRLSAQEKLALGLGKTSTIVLLCTEGERVYQAPLPVSIQDPVSLAQVLVQINSANPDGATTPGPGETRIARYIAAWLEHRDIETHWVEKIAGRPSVVGVARGVGGGKSLMLNGHTDTVTLSGYDGDALSGRIEDGKLYGRGAADMKAGVAAALIALARAKEEKLKGDVIFTAVADEENFSIGTEQVLEAGWRADGAIVCEPTDLDLVIGHKGFVWLEVDIHGVAAHGSQPSAGIDAISRAGYFLVKLDKLSHKLSTGSDGSLLGPPSVHGSMIQGGEEPASYPAKCTITLEWRSVPGESPESIRNSIERLLREVAEDMDGFSYETRITFSRPPFIISDNHPFVSICKRKIEETVHQHKKACTRPFWTDCALLAERGIPTVLYGPKGEGLHAKTEWADVESIKSVTDTLSSIAREFCG